MHQKVKHGTLPRQSGSPSMVPGPASSASPRKLWEMQVLKPHFRPIESETEEGGGGGRAQEGGFESVLPSDCDTC